MRHGYKRVRHLGGVWKLAVAGIVLLTVAAVKVGAQPVGADQETAASTDEYGGPYVTNVFYESDIRDALRDISVQAGIPIVPDASVQGFVTLEVENVPLEDCLTRVLAPGGYTFKKMDGYYIVGSPFPDNPAFPSLSAAKLIRPNYVKAADVPNLLSTFYEPFLKVDGASNTIVVTASPEIIERFTADLAAIDVPPKQVMIEALVTEFSKNAMRKTGVDWRVIGSGPDYTLSLISLLTDRTDSTMLIDVTRPDGRAGRFAHDLRATVQALAETGELKVHANPRVATLDGHPALIFLGREEYYELITGPVTYPYARLEMIKVGITLKIRPYTAENGDITVEIEPEVSDVTGKGATALPVVLKRSVSTKVRVKDGETIAIGGLVQKTERKRVTKIPLLGDIPVIGYFFSSTTPETDESEVVIFITPHVLE